MRKVEPAKAFRKDLKRERKGRFRLTVSGELWEVVYKIANDIPLEHSYNDHPLHGDWEGSRDCHVKPDLVLIYTLDGEDRLILERLGTHSEIFGL